MRTLDITEQGKYQVEAWLKENEYIEPFEIVEYVEPPTPEQLKYAKDLGIPVLHSDTKEDVSCRISKVVDHDSDPNPQLIDFANGRGMLFSDYIGKKQLYNLIWNNLEWIDKIAFFCFCVYRDLSDDRYGNLDKSPHKDVFYGFAQMMIGDSKFAKSIDENYFAEDMRFFGVLRFDDGETITGGSKSTYAYQECANFLYQKFGLERKKETKLHKKNERTTKKQEKSPQLNKKDVRNGCILMIVLIVILGAIIKSCFSCSDATSTMEEIYKEDGKIDNKKASLKHENGRWIIDSSEVKIDTIASQK
jgi:hypothetical protein